MRNLISASGEQAFPQAGKKMSPEDVEIIQKKVIDLLEHILVLFHADGF